MIVISENTVTGVSSDKDSVGGGGGSEFPHDMGPGI